MTRTSRQGTGRRDDSGAAAVEFALVVLPLVLTILAVLFLALHMVFGALAEKAARNAARYATLRTSQGYPGDADITRVAGQAVGSSLGSPKVVITTPDGRSLPGARVTVQVTYQVPALETVANLVPFLGLDGAATVTRTASGRLE